MSDPGGGSSVYRPPALPGDGEPQTLGSTVSDLTRDLSTLMRQEVALARAEVRASVTEAGRGVGMYVGAGVAGFLVLLFLSTALWWGIGNSTGRGWAGLIVAAIWLVICVVLVLVGRQEFRKTKGLPQTAETLSKVPNALKGNEQENR